MVSASLPVIVQLLERRIGAAAGTFLNAGLFGDVAALLCGRMAQGRLHWREALITHLLCLHLVPLTVEQNLLEQLLTTQAHGLLQGTSLMCKVLPCSGPPRLSNATPAGCSAHSTCMFCRAPSVACLSARVRCCICD